jgi:hypothetical protein
MTRVVNYKTQKWEECSVRRLLEALLREVLPKQREAWVIDRKAVAAKQVFAVPEM